MNDKMIHFISGIKIRTALLRCRLFSLRFQSEKKLHLRITAGVFILIAVFLLFNTVFQLVASIARNPDHISSYIVDYSEREIESFRKKVLRWNRFRNVHMSLYEIKLGDNFWTVAQRNGININTIVGLNPYITDLLARERQNILVCSNTGAIHVVRAGETLKGVAKFYNIEIEQIRRRNRIPFPGGLRKGDLLFIPGVTPQMVTDPIHAQYAKKKMFISPCAGRYTRGFGWDIHPVTKKRAFHKGLDIRGKYGALVCAAAGGTVTYSGEMGNYGNVVIVKHDNGFTTLYSHNSVNLVRAGRRVVQGQVLARVGHSGRVTGTHLHFEVRTNEKPVNPAQYLW